MSSDELWAAAERLERRGLDPEHLAMAALLRAINEPFWDEAWCEGVQEAALAVARVVGVPMNEPKGQP